MLAFVRLLLINILYHSRDPLLILKTPMLAGRGPRAADCRHPRTALAENVRVGVLS